MAAAKPSSRKRTDTHVEQTLVPTSNHLSNTQRELECLSTIQARVKLLAIGGERACCCAFAEPQRTTFTHSIGKRTGVVHGQLVSLLALALAFDLHAPSSTTRTRQKRNSKFVKTSRRRASLAAPLNVNRLHSTHQLTFFVTSMPSSPAVASATSATSTRIVNILRVARIARFSA